MDFNKIEKKWNDIWEQTDSHTFTMSDTDNKYYVLEMFSYPSAANLHLGHWYNYGLSDSFARFKRMQGKRVFQPMGFDAFGLPAENYAIRTGIHPKDSTYKNIETMERQLKNMGAMFDWSKELYTCDPAYYKWTQWLFLELYKHGLAYRKNAPVNWCSHCNTVIANEQVIDGVCERCETEVQKKELTQWFFKITDYAEELLQGLDQIDWPQKTKAMQRNWIGRSEGGEIIFDTETGDQIAVFTTRADTLMGVSYIVLAPENPLVKKLTTAKQKNVVEQYQTQTAKTTEIERLSTVKEKTGVFIGSYAKHPVTGERLQIWIADYVLATYGTGAVMGVPAHDERDFAFAKKYKLTINRVIRSADGSPDDLPYTEDGIMENSGQFTGMPSVKGRDSVLEYLQQNGRGGNKINYRLRDWSVSRQRFWGVPIPIIHCEHCGAVPVPEEDLPVELPYDVNFTPDGQSPLKKSPAFINTVCPVCGKPAKREADTLDTFVCSSWYYLRFPDAHNSKAAFDTALINKMLPVDKYIGGAEHACMHLLYARFINKALRDFGYLNFDEPFISLVHQGLILGPDGFKMSKNRGNVVNPDTYISRYGSDVFRLHLMFSFNYTEGGPWNDDGIRSVSRFIDRVERLALKCKDYPDKEKRYDTAEKELDFALHYAIKNYTRDFEEFGFNTAVARIMELVNALYKYEQLADSDPGFLKSTVKQLILLLAPCTPHFSEELNQILGSKVSVFDQPLPVCDESKLVKDDVEILVQINSKPKVKLIASSSMSKEELEQFVLSHQSVLQALDGKPVKKAIVIPGKLINLVV